MASGPRRRRRGAWVGAGVALGIALALSLGLFRSSGEAVEPRAESSLSAIRADGKLVLRVIAPQLY